MFYFLESQGTGEGISSAGRWPGPWWPVSGASWSLGDRHCHGNGEEETKSLRWEHVGGSETE